MTTTEKIENIVKKLKTRKSKNIIYFLIMMFVVLCFCFRFYVVQQENNVQVFNITRNNLENGLPVDTLKIEKTDGILYEPLTIKNNTAYVSGARVNTFKSGQKVGDCKIVSVSKDLDLDTGMYIIKTAKCSDGLKYAAIHKNGFFVPVSAVYGNNVFIADNNIAHARPVVISGRDAQNVLITSGLQDGDIIILSDVSDNQKIKTVK